MAPPQSLQQRISNAVDVPAAFDNCFFHSYGAYLIANDLPLPDDLFHFSSVLGTDSPASRLQTVLAHHDPTRMFYDYFQYLPRERGLTHRLYLVEKTLIYGILLREWFATKLFHNDLHREEMLAPGDNSVQRAFMGYKDFRSSMTKEELLASSPLLQSNEAFLEALVSYPHASRPESHSRFDHYFREADGNEERAIALYWQAEGYQHYCQYLAMPNVKISPRNFIPVMLMLNQSMNIYHTSGQVIESVQGSTIQPAFELVLNPLSGHYFLLKTPYTTTRLQEYERAYTQYKEDRTVILAAENNQWALAKNQPSLFVAAICPSEHVTWEPFDALLRIILDMQQLIQQEKMKTYKGKFNALLQQLTEQQDSLFASNIKAHRAATRLCEGLTNASILYFASQQRESDYQTFKETCFTHIETERNTLQDFVGWEQLLANIALFIVLMGVGYVAAIAINKKVTGHYLFFSPKTEANLNNMIDSVNDTNPVLMVSS